LINPILILFIWRLDIGLVEKILDALLVRKRFAITFMNLKEYAENPSSPHNRI